MKEGFHVNLSMNIKGNEEEDNTAEPIYQKKTEEIVDFFKSIVNIDPSYCLKVPEEFSIPTMYEEFVTGSFLHNPKFLIQSYFFEYIDSVEMYEGFVRAVYTLLNEQIPNKDGGGNSIAGTEKYVKAIFDCLFIKEGLFPQKLDICEAILNFKNLKDQFMKPIDTQSQEPLKAVYFPYYIKISTMFNGFNETHNSQMFKKALHGLLCCLTYDPETNKYTTDHLPNASKELKDFFEKYNKPVKEVSYTRHLEWGRVISKFEEDTMCRILNNKVMDRVGRNIINMLTFIFSLTGDVDGVAGISIKEIRKLVESKYEPNDVSIKDHIKNFFTALSRNKKINVETYKNT
ncbi:hypothetical protein NEIRO03_1775 [Nematocida sp. AWRm78]|nr:hypothetical protein NEIRO02_1651 [Nematocida sp. AWRm79]KAI5184647.1 hypothetical protein NEIRO03_1775 [Nematocida sp. AWRm78]